MKSEGEVVRQAFACHANELERVYDAEFDPNNTEKRTRSDVLIAAAILTLAETLYRKWF